MGTIRLKKERLSRVETAVTVGDSWHNVHLIISIQLKGRAGASFEPSVTFYLVTITQTRLKLMLDLVSSFVKGRGEGEVTPKTFAEIGRAHV